MVNGRDALLRSAAPKHGMMMNERYTDEEPEVRELIDTHSCPLQPAVPTALYNSCSHPLTTRRVSRPKHCEHTTRLQEKKAGWMDPAPVVLPVAYASF